MEPARHEFSGVCVLPAPLSPVLSSLADCGFRFESEDITCANRYVELFSPAKTVPRKWSPSLSCIELDQLGSGHSWYWSLSFNPKFWPLLWLLARVTLLVLLSVSMKVLHGCCMLTKLNRGEAVKIRSCSLVGVRSVPTCLLFLFASRQQQDIHVETTRGWFFPQN